MPQGQNKTNTKVSKNIQNAFKEGSKSESSVTGFKERDLQSSRKNIKR